MLQVKERPGIMLYSIMAFDKGQKTNIVMKTPSVIDAAIVQLITAAEKKHLILWQEEHLTGNSKYFSSVSGNCRKKMCCLKYSDVS